MQIKCLRKAGKILCMEHQTELAVVHVHHTYLTHKAHTWKNIKIHKNTIATCTGGQLNSVDYSAMVRS